MVSPTHSPRNETISSSLLKLILHLSQILSHLNVLLHCAGCILARRINFVISSASQRRWCGLPPLLSLLSSVGPIQFLAMISTRKQNQTTVVEQITITLACHKPHCSALWVIYSNSSHGINKKAESTLTGIILKILKLGSIYVQQGSVNLVLKDKIIENWNWSLNLKWVCFLAFFDLRLFSLVVGSA